MDQPPAPPLIIGHRGASQQAPENTLPSFRLAWRQGADGIEGDFWLTGDGQLVCIHDQTTERTAPGQQVYEVTRATLADLKTLDVGSWKGEPYHQTTIPSLAEILAELPQGCRMYLEVKQDEPELVAILLATARTCRTPLSQLTVIAFGQEILRTCKEQCPELQGFLLYELTVDENTGLVTPSAELLVAMARACGSDGVGLGNCHLLDQDYVDTLKANGLSCHVWTVNSEQEARHCHSLGIDSLTTDRPDELRQMMSLS